MLLLNNTFLFLVCHDAVRGLLQPAQSLKTTADNTVVDGMNNTINMAFCLEAVPSVLQWEN